MIKTNEYCFDISIGVENSSRGVVKDFLKENDLIYFELRIHSGMAIPYIKCDVKCYDNSIVSCFKQGSIVNITFGSDEQNLYTYECAIGGISITKMLESETETIIAFEAVILEKSSKFILNTDNLAKQGTSLEVIKSLGKEFFGTEVVTDIKSTDIQETPMIWMQNSMMNNVFLGDIWLHMNITPDIPLLYIDDKLVIHINSYNKLKESEPKVTFTQSAPEPGKQQIVFRNVFSPQSRIAKINAIATNESVYIRDVDTNKVNVIFSDNNYPEIAATKEVEKGGYGHSTKHNRLEGGNVYKGYKKTYHYNRTKLNRLSAISSHVEIIGVYKGVNVNDLVRVIGVAKEYTGNYLVSDIVYTIGHGQPAITTVWLCRDNINYLESYIKKKDVKNAYENLESEIRKFYTLVRDLRVYVQKARYLVDGSLFRDLQKFIHQLKYDLLRSFSVCGIPLDFNSTQELVQSIRSIGMSILNQIVRTYLPTPFNTLLINYPGGAKTKEVVSKLLTDYARHDVRLLVREIQGLVFDITDGLGRVSKNASVGQKALTANSNINNDNVSFTDTADGVTDIQIIEKEGFKMEDIDKEVNNILQEFLNNTSEVDIPLPLIELNESEKLYTAEELRNLLADIVISDLESRGYLQGVDNFKAVLLGEVELTFEQVNIINHNTGLILYPRFWGVYNTPNELTYFYITEQFRDMYKTPDFMKLVSAKKGQHIFVAFPTFEKNLKIFINSYLQSMEIIEDMDLGIRDKSGNIIKYNVYVSPNGYNSNSNLLEVRK